MTKLHPHCGQCSQCIDRRFAILAASQAHEDPEDAYKIDLLLGGREPGPDREMSLAFVRSASKVSQMTDVDFFAHYGESSRVLSFFHEPANTVARRIFGLYQRHAAAVRKVFNDGVEANKANIWNGRLTANCLISLIVGQSGEGASYPTSISTTKPAEVTAQEIRMSIDEKRVMFERWGEIRGRGAELLIALAAPFREARQNELHPERYPYLRTQKLGHQLNCGSEEALRRRVLHCRNKIQKLAKDADDAEPAIDAVIESNQWHGYRLNPDRVRLVTLSR
jgi:hypothetical protein